MKYFILLLALTVLTTQLQAQTREHDYIPLVVENAQWIISLDDFEGTLYTDYFYGYKIEGDTLINDTEYKKVYWRGYSNFSTTEPPYWLGTYRLFGAIREDTEAKQVFGIAFSDETGENARCEYVYGAGYLDPCPLDEEFMMFDYSLGVGDYFDELCGAEYNNSYAIDQAIDMYLYGENRYTQGNIGPLTIEGIGSEIGLFEPLLPEISGSYHTLEAFCIGTDAECWPNIYPYDVATFDLQIKIIITPNPVVNMIHIQNNSQQTILSLKLYDTFGKELKYVKEQVSSLNTEGLSPGIYGLLIETDKGRLFKKIVKK